ncbi:4374_t:CDS:2, partial [Acaulospora colombiana]
VNPAPSWIPFTTGRGTKHDASSTRPIIDSPPTIAPTPIPAAIVSCRVKGLAIATAARTFIAPDKTLKSPEKMRVDVREMQPAEASAIVSGRNCSDFNNVGRSISRLKNDLILVKVLGILSGDLYRGTLWAVKVGARLPISTCHLYGGTDPTYRPIVCSLFYPPTRGHIVKPYQALALPGSTVLGSLSPERPAILPFLFCISALSLQDK